VSSERRAFPLARRLLVLATQKPTGFEGTYPHARVAARTVQLRIDVDILKGRLRRRSWCAYGVLDGRTDDARKLLGQLDPARIKLRVTKFFADRSTVIRSTDRLCAGPCQRFT